MKKNLSRFRFRTLACLHRNGKSQLRVKTWPCLPWTTDEFAAGDGVTYHLLDRLLEQLHYSAVARRLGRRGVLRHFRCGGCGRRWQHVRRRRQDVGERPGGRGAVQLQLPESHPVCYESIQLQLNSRRKSLLSISSPESLSGRSEIRLASRLPKLSDWLSGARLFRKVNIHYPSFRLAGKECAYLDRFETTE